MYTKPVGGNIKCHNINYHYYADNIQVCMVLKPEENSDNISTEVCVVNIGNCVISHMLKFNHRKSINYCVTQTALAENWESPY